MKAYVDFILHESKIINNNNHSIILFNRKEQTCSHSNSSWLFQLFFKNKI